MQYDDEWDDDDWDDDISDTNQGSHVAPSAAGRSNSDVSNSVDMMNLASKIGDGKGTVRKNLNRFSAFVKTGGEAYILGTFKPHVSESDKIYIIQTNEGIEWKSDQQPYSCSVDSPKKETKMKGKD